MNVNSDLTDMRALFLFVAALGAVACEGDTGPVGPEGPPGSANVTSGTFTVAVNAWTNGFWFMPIDGGTQANPAKVATVTVPGITSDLVENGAVLIYLRVPSTPVGASNQWTLLPFHQGGFGGGYLVSIKAAVSAGQVRIGYAHETTGPTTAPDVYTIIMPAYEFRWVGISQAAIPSLALLPLEDPDAVIQALRQ
jgi:hypothetical protein